MKYPFMTKYKGVYYNAGEEVPIEEKEQPKNEKTESQPEVKVEETVKETVKEQPKQPQYNRTQINRMNLETLRKLAMSLGISGAEDKTGGELKRIIPEQLGI